MPKIIAPILEKIPIKPNSAGIPLSPPSLGNTTVIAKLVSIKSINPDIEIIHPTVNGLILASPPSFIL